MKILMVEDNFQMRRLLKSMLAGLADEFYECADGADVRAAYACHQPDVVLMDIRMGRVDGITATQQIRAAHPSARVIIVTDYDQPDLREAAREAGACGYVVKDNLLELVERLKDEAPPRSPSPNKSK